MKKQILLYAALFAAVITTNAQTYWTTDLMNVESSDQAKLGTSSFYPLNFYTNGQKQIEIDEFGRMKILRLANPSDTRRMRLLVIDNEGNVSTVGKQVPEDQFQCGTGGTPWLLGGNNYSSTHSPYDPFQIGTCVDAFFSLKAKDRNLLFINPNGSTGIGENNSYTDATLDISSPAQGGQRDHLRIYGDNEGAIESTASMHLYFDDQSQFAISRGTEANPISDMFTMSASGASFIGTGNVLNVVDETTGVTNFRVKNDGVVYSRELNVMLGTFPDYVFAKDYKLLSLESLDKYIKENKHLPNVPTAKEVESNGANIGELAKIQMEKIEELTLYVIELKKEIEALKKQQGNK